MKTMLFGLICSMGVSSVIAQSVTETAPTSSAKPASVNKELLAESQYIIDLAKFYRTKGLSGKEEVLIKKDPIFSHVDAVRKEQGAIWLVGKEGRPLGVSIIYLNADEPNWAHAVRSFSTTKDVAGDFVGGRIRWRPSTAGVTFAKLPKSPKTTKRGKLLNSQMKQQARRFSGYEMFGKDRVEMRLIPRELHRYQDKEAGVVAGALFAIAHATNPETFLLLEVRDAGDGKREWHYGLGRFTFAAINVTIDGKDVWKKPAIRTTRPNQDYHIFHVPRVPAEMMAQRGTKATAKSNP